MKIRIAILMFLFSSCGPQLPDRQAAVYKFYKIKVDALMHQQKEECQDRIAQDAKAKVDSIIHQILNADLMDTINFPSKPVRPSAPDHIIGTVKKFDSKN